MIAEVTELAIPDLRGDEPAAICLLSVCQYFHIEPEGAGDFERFLERSQSGEVRLDDFLAAAADAGLEAWAGRIDVDQLRDALAAGMPVITDMGHGRAVVAYGMTEDGILLLDPEEHGQVAISLEEWPGVGILLDAPGAELSVQEDEVPAHKFSSTQFNLADAGYSRSEGSPLEQIGRLRDQIADADLADDGKEMNPHITVKYGLHTNDADEVRRVVENWVSRNKRTLEASLGAVSLFPADEETVQRGGDAFDVVKIDVDSADLRSLNTALASAIEHTDTHPVYNPHLTLAYVNPGCGAKYCGPGLNGHKVLLHQLVFSDQHGNKTVIDLWDGISAEDEHRDLAHHYAATWNVLHDQGQRVPHWELDGAHENLAGTDWHVDLGHDGVWRPLHHEDMQRVYLWPAVEKGHGASVRKSQYTPPTVAVDLDGTLAEYDGWKGEDHFGTVRPGAVEALISLRNRGCRIIIFTTRGDRQRVGSWLKEHHIPFDYINENPDQPPGTSGKVIADLYIDDRAIDARPDWKQVLEEALSRLDEKTKIQKRHGAAVEKSRRRGEVEVRLYRAGEELARHVNPAPMPGYGQIFVNDDDSGGHEAEVWYVGGDGDEDGFGRVVEKKIKEAFPGCKQIHYEAEAFPPEDAGWKQVYPRREAKGPEPEVEKARKKPVRPEPGLFGNWVDPARPHHAVEHPRSSTEFEGMHPRRGHGARGGQFAKLNTGTAPGQQQLFGGQWEENQRQAPTENKPEEKPTPAAPSGKWSRQGNLFAPRVEPQVEPPASPPPATPPAAAAAGEPEGTHHAPKGGVTIAGDFFPGGQFIPNEELAKATPQERQNLLNKEAESVQNAETQAHQGSLFPTIPAEAKPKAKPSSKAAQRAQQTRQRKLTEARGEVHGELLGRTGSEGTGGGLFAGEHLRESSPAQPGGDQAGTVSGTSPEGRSGQLPDSAGAQRAEPVPEPSGSGNEPVSGTGSDAAAVGGPVANEGGRGGGEPGAELGAATPPTPAEAVLSQPATPQTPTDLSAGNFRYDSRDFFAGGPKAKVRNNIEAIRTLKAIQAEGRTHATPEEQQILSKYVGWGAFAQPIFAPRYGDEYRAWEKEREAVQGLLSETEYEAARNSTTNAHYTHPDIVDAHWKMAQRLGFKGGRFLETSAGIGYYLGLMPADLSAKTRASAVELDTTTGNMLKLLYPASNVRVEGFEQFQMPDNWYDLVASNVPFGKHRPYDPRYEKHQARIHDYFFLKSLDLARPGALVMHITSSGTMDKPDDAIRKELASKAELVAAIRFPGGAHKENAGTEVVTDLLILRKKDPSMPPAPEATPPEAQPKEPHFTGTLTDSLGRLYYFVDGKRVPGPDWTQTTLVPDPAGGEPIPVNKYFADNPEQILGRLDRTGSMYHENNVNVSRTEDYEQRLQAAIGRLPHDVLHYAQTSKKAFEPQRLPAPEDVLEGGLVVKGGKVYQKQGNELIEQKVASKDVPRVAGQLQILGALRSLVKADRQGAGSESLRAELNRVYDSFVRKYGPLSNRANAKAFGCDADAAALLSLEDYDKATGEAKKADIFRKNTIRPDIAIDRAGSAVEALGVCLNQRGGVDLDHMAQLAGLDRAALELELVQKGLAFHDPQEGWKPADQYLSGNVRRKLLMARAAAAADPMYEANVKALEQVQPEDIEPHRIGTKLGAPWIPADDVKEFAAHLLEGKPEDFSIRYVPETGSWLVDLSSRGKYLYNRQASRETWGTPRKSFIDLLEAALQGRTVAVYDQSADGQSFINRQATDDANAKIDDIKKAFQNWIWEEDQRRERLHRYYNDNYNNIRNIRYDGSHLTFPGMNPLFQMRDHQKDFVWQSIVTGKGLAAHEVGSGKTATLIASAMEARRLGLAHKPALAVKKANIEDITAFARWLYPGARILSTADVNNAAQRKQMMSRIATGDYDLAIMTHDHLNMMDMLPETQADFLRQQLTDLRAAKMRALETADGKKSDPTVKNLADAEANLNAKLKKAIDSKKKDDALYFENSGIDMLLVDESHAFKNLQPATRMNNVKGIPSSQSERAVNMLMRTRWLMDNNGGRGVIFATGTPVSNSMVELYTLQKFLQPKELEERGLHHFDAWAQTFGDLLTKREFKPSGEYEPVTRFGKFVNIPELMQMTREFMDVQYVDDLKNADGSPQVIRPRKQVEAVVSPLTPELSAYMASLKERAKRIKGKKVVKGGDNMLVICTDGRKASVDMRLVDPEAADDPGSKTNQVVNKVLALHTERPDVTQVIFSNLQRSQKNESFNLYQDIIGKLVAGGIPREKIADFSQLEGEKKDKAQEAMRQGDILVGIGGTDTLGTGVNVQNKLAAMHHLDVPDRPSDIEQRDGRGFRQGNVNDPTKPADQQTVHSYRYIAEGSADQTFWQRIANKMFWQRQALKSTGKELAREIENEDTDEMSPERFIAIASGDPRVMEKVDLEDEVKRLRDAWDRHERQQYRFQQTVKAGEAQTPHLERRLEGMRQDEKTLADNPDFSMTIDGKTYTERKEAAEAFNKKAEQIGGTYTAKPIGQYRGLDIYRHGARFYLAGQGGEYDVGPSVPSVEAVARRQNVRIREGEEGLKAHREDVEKARMQLGKQWVGGDELKQKEQRLAELEAELSGKKLADIAAESGHSEEATPHIEEGTPHIEPEKSTHKEETPTAPRPAATPRLDKWLESVHRDVQELRDKNSGLLIGKDVTDRLKRELENGTITQEHFDKLKEKGTVLSDADYKRAQDVQAEIDKIRDRPMPTEKEEANPAPESKPAEAHEGSILTEPAALAKKAFEEGWTRAYLEEYAKRNGVKPSHVMAAYHRLSQEKQLRDLKAIQDRNASKPEEESQSSPPSEPTHSPETAQHPGQMSQERKNAIHQGLRQLHGNNADYAREINGVGFNKLDSEFGGRLAESEHLTDKQAEAAAKMLHKYRGQLGDELHSKITKPDEGYVPAEERKVEPKPEETAPPPPLSIKRQQTRRGERSLHSFAPGESFWQARKAGKIPSNVTVRKDPRSGRWEASVWGADDEEVKRTVEQMRKNGVRL